MDDVRNWLRLAQTSPEEVPESEAAGLISTLRDRQEANSIKYGNGKVILVPLSSGRLGVLRGDYKLIEILDEIDVGKVIALAQLSMESARAESRRVGRGGKGWGPNVGTTDDAPTGL